MAFKCREKFHSITKDVLRWFPGHMNLGMKQMQRKLKSVDCIIEVHDARIPFSGRNPNFRQMLTAIKPHLLVLNKIDLADMRHRDQIEKELLAGGVDEIAYTNCKESRYDTIRALLPTVEKLIQNSDRFSRSGNRELSLMVIGIPNVGKSSLINRLRNLHLNRRNATRVGALPGITTSVLERIKISEDPKMYLLDTPGVLSPKILNVEVGLRLALCSILKDHLVGEDVIADYLLYWLNKHDNFSYVEYLGLDGPCDDIRMVLLRTAVKLNKVRQARTDKGLQTLPDWRAAASYFVGAFRMGLLGQHMLDDDHFK